MDFSGEYRINASREKVWEALNDAAILKVCIDGCESLEWVGEGELAAVVAIKVGPLTARFSGKLWLTDVQAPHSYVLNGQGQGGAAGFAKGSAAIALVEDGGDTLLRYRTAADIGGKLADVGSQMVQGLADKTADQFFERFVQRLRVALLAAEAGATTGAPEVDGEEGLSWLQGSAARLQDWDALLDEPLEGSHDALRLARPLIPLTNPQALVIPVGWALFLMILALILFVR